MGCFCPRWRDRSCSGGGGLGVGDDRGGGLGGGADRITSPDEKVAIECSRIRGDL